MSKKLYSTLRWKEYMRARQEYELRALRRRRSHRGRTRVHKPRTRRKWFKLRVPSTFSILRNPEETIEFLREFGRRAKDFELELDLKSVDDISIDAITALIAEIRNAESRDLTAVRGNSPSNAKAREILDQSGFFAYLRSQKPPSYLGKIAQQRSSRRVEPPVARDLIHFATKAITGNAQRCQAAYRVLIESMNNTHNHASGKHHERETWWATAYADKSRNHICFAFLDTGVGIFKSVRIATVRKIYQALGIWDNGDLLKDILAGKVESRTGQPHRGKGLPAINRLLLESRLSNLTIVANDVHADIGAGEYKKLRNSFRGTLLYWEIRLP